MKLAVVANNYGERYDGIGAFAKVECENFPRNVSYTIYTSRCLQSENVFSKLMKKGMTLEISKLSKEYLKKGFDAVLIEYPFVEWNPRVLLQIRKLKKVIVQNNGKLVISIHEYRRTNRLRKKAIIFLCKLADVVLVSNENIQHDLEFCNDNIVIREIPTNIYEKDRDVDQVIPLHNSYCFFGLINKSKAFNEMLEAWDLFNVNEDNILYIISSTHIDNIEKYHKRIKIIKNAPNSTIIDIMSKCQFSIIPIKPEIDNKNATFKTSSMCGCISIGKFCDEFKKLDFTINIKNYSVEEIEKALIDSKYMNALKEKRTNAIRFAQKYNPEVVAKNIYKIIEDSEELSKK